VTPTTVGWVLAEGHGADGTILDHNELALSAGRGVRAVNTAEQVTDEVLRVHELAGASDRHLRVIGVTWNDQAAAQAALVMEALTDAGFDNVVPVRLLEAVETLAVAIAPIIGYQQTAVCVLEHESSTVVMVDGLDDDAQTVVKEVAGGFDGLRSWLTGMFKRTGWRPGGVVVVGADDDLNGFSWQLEKALPVPVFAQTMAQVTVARGTALAAAQSTEFTDEQLVDVDEQPVAAPTARPGRRSYAGAVTALAAGAVTFVCSASFALGIQFAPDAQRGTNRHTTPTPQVAEAVAPVAAHPPAAESPAPPAPQAPAPAGEPVVHPSVPDEQQGGDERRDDANGRQPYLTRVLEHIPGDAGDQAPNGPAQP
ncbi:membrane protein, partial [Mycobacterium rhizamassiliense]